MERRPRRPRHRAVSSAASPARPTRHRTGAGFFHERGKGEVILVIRFERKIVWQKVEEFSRKTLSVRQVVKGGILREASDGTRLIRGHVPRKTLRPLI